jgi:hypothetical protein
MTTRRGLEQLLSEYRGDADGTFKTDRLGTATPSHQLKKKMQIDELNERFEHLNQHRINRGMRPLTTMNDEMYSELMKLEAEQDILKDEVKKLEELLAQKIEAESRTDDKAVLQYGPRGDSYSGRLDKVITELDGQMVSPDPSGVLRIRDERSPYHGMDVIDYREQVIPTFHAQQKKKRAERLARAQQAARERGLPVPMKPPITGGVIRKEDLPGWPADVEKFNWAKVQ